MPLPRDAPEVSSVQQILGGLSWATKAAELSQARYVSHGRTAYAPL